MKVLCSTLLFAVRCCAQDRIVFERQLDINTWDIFLMRSDSRFPTNLTNGRIDAKSTEPTISPDGKMVAYTNNHDGFGLTDIYVMDLVPRRVRQITISFPYVVHAPEWSPDGQRIAYSQCDPQFTNCDIYTVNADGTGTPTPLANSPQNDDNARFSPDGSRVVFMSNRDGNDEIYVCNANGSGVQRLTTNTVPDEWPAWSPDGTRIVFSSLRDRSPYELYLMNSDGSNVVRLTQDSASDNNASFSSDGRRIVWSRQFGSTYEIVEAPLEAMGQFHRLTSNGIDDLSPDYGFVTRKVGR